MPDFKLTDDDVIYLAFGTAAQGIFQWYMRSRSTTFPTLLNTLMIGGIGLGGGFVGMTGEKLPRAAAAFLIGFGLSQVISYILPRITGGSVATRAAGAGYGA